MADFHPPAVFYRLVCYAILTLFFFPSKSSLCGARDLASGHHAAEMSSVIPTADKGSAYQFKGLKGMNLKRCRRRLLQDGFFPTNGNNGQDIILPLRADSDGNFFVTVGIGTPKRDFNMFFDTGSYLTWVQCQPCSGSCNPQGQFYQPSDSSTFSNATCDPTNPTCEYNIGYHDSSYSKGLYIKDTLTLTSKGVYQEFLFGCANTIGGNFAGADGLLGIGQGKYSLMAQTDTNFFSIFCYCLPATQSSTGYLTFGVQAFETCKPETSQMIPLSVAQEEDKFTNYFVHLLGISIGNQRLDIPASSKTIIDSGTSFTRLPPSVYSALRDAFRAMMSAYPVASPTELFDTCYTLDQGHAGWTPPAMMLHFENSIDVKLDPSAVTFVESGSQVCLAFIGNKNEDDFNIIGNRQHRELQVFYEIGGAKLAFGTGGCST